MRRGIAIVLALAFSWLAILPAFAASSDSTMPACCRKDGKHHCTMQAKQSRGSEAAISVAAKKCPYYPRSTTTPQAQFCEPRTSPAVFAGLVRHPAVSPQTEASYRISYDRSRQKRGPPFLILV